MATEPAEHPTELCGYGVVETLAEDATHLAIGPGGRGIVLKKLDPDCLYGALLHPDVRDRLQRVRELAHPGVANLMGVGKEGADAWLIWEYLEGRTFAVHAMEKCTKPRELAALVRELVLTVESLHMQGIVHGSLHSGNIIVMPDGAVRLTHISPLLYTEVADDAETMTETVENVLEQCSQGDGALGRLMAEARQSNMLLRTLASRLAILAGGQEGDESPVAMATAERRTRRRAVFGAVVVALAGIAAAFGVWHTAGRPGSERLPAWLK